MRTVNLVELKELIAFAREELRSTLLWPRTRACGDLSVKSLPQLEASQARARKFARRKLRRMVARLPNRRRTIHQMWLFYVLEVEAWRFAVWLREQQGGWDQFDAANLGEEFELLFLSHIGAEIKRLGFELEG